MFEPVIFTPVWWKAALIRAGRSALVIAIPYIPASYVGNTPYLTIVSAAALGFVLSLLTSLAGIAEAAGVKLAWYYSILERVVKTIAQALVAGVGTAVLFQDVNWSGLLQLAITAGFGSLLLAVLTTLPESDKPVAAASATYDWPQSDGSYARQDVPVVASLPLPTAPDDSGSTEGPYSR